MCAMGAEGEVTLDDARYIGGGGSRRREAWGFERSHG